MNITALVKTFLRDEYMKVCVESLIKTYPGIKIVIGDDGYVTTEKEKLYKKWESKNVRKWYLPFDCGLCVGRNFLTNRIDTKYVLIGDDDFYYTKETGVEKMYELMEANHRIDILGGRVSQDGKVGDYQGTIHVGKKKLVYDELEQDDWKEMAGVRYKDCDITYNFLLIRMDALKKVSWDENIKVAYEHSDFFLEAKKAGLNVAFTPDACVVHKPEHVKFDAKEYGEYRNRITDKKYFWDKWDLDIIFDFNNNVSTRDW